MANLALVSKIDSDTEMTQLFLAEAKKVVFGKDRELKLALTTLLAKGHLLIEDIPGMGKTTFVTCLAKLMGLKLNRIQFTNDLLPADIIGTSIYDSKTGEFRFLPGPIFTEIVLGDELNRASPKSQSAFLQAMEERTVSIEGRTLSLPNPFFIIATQNPNTQVGTNPLPESQLDRFLMKLSIGYPDRESETELLKGGNPRDKIETLPVVLPRERLLQAQDAVSKIHASEALIEYVQDLLTAARAKNYPLSPRAGLLLLQAARSWAFLDQRTHLIPEDIQDVAAPVLAHRITNAPTNAIEELLQQVHVP